MSEQKKEESVPALFSSPLEDTSGLDVFAQIAASITPIPVVNKPPTGENSLIQRRHSSASVVQQNQNQLAQSIYQTQQALRQQHTRSSTTSNTGSSYSDFNSDFDSDFDDDDSTPEEEHKPQPSKQPLKPLKFISYQPQQPQTIQEESESDLAMDVDSTFGSRSTYLSPSTSLGSLSTPSLPTTALRRSSLPANAFSSENGPVSNRRIIHNICERKRRENIREGFAYLQARLPQPHAQNPKLSKMDILQSALTIIDTTRARISSLTDECEALKLMTKE